MQRIETSLKNKFKKINVPHEWEKTLTLEQLKNILKLNVEEFRTKYLQMTKKQWLENKHKLFSSCFSMNVSGIINEIEYYINNYNEEYYTQERYINTMNEYIKKYDMLNLHELLIHFKCEDDWQYVKERSNLSIQNIKDNLTKQLSKIQRDLRTEIYYFIYEEEDILEQLNIYLNDGYPLDDLFTVNAFGSDSKPYEPPSPKRLKHFNPSKLYSFDKVKDIQSYFKLSDTKLKSIMYISANRRLEFNSIKNLKLNDLKVRDFYYLFEFLKQKQKEELMKKQVLKVQRDIKKQKEDRELQLILENEELQKRIDELEEELRVIKGDSSDN